MVAPARSPLGTSPNDLSTTRFRTLVALVRTLVARNGVVPRTLVALSNLVALSK
jgi:hypothetical protein